METRHSKAQQQQNMLFLQYSSMFNEQVNQDAKVDIISFITGEYGYGTATSNRIIHEIARLNHTILNSTMSPTKLEILSKEFENVPQVHNENEVSPAKLHLIERMWRSDYMCAFFLREIVTFSEPIIATFNEIANIRPPAQAIMIIEIIAESWSLDILTALSTAELLKIMDYQLWAEPGIQKGCNLSPAKLNLVKAALGADDRWDNIGGTISILLPLPDRLSEIMTEIIAITSKSDSYLAHVISKLDDRVLEMLPPAKLLRLYETKLYPIEFLYKEKYENEQPIKIVLDMVLVSTLLSCQEEIMTHFGKDRLIDLMHKTSCTISEYCLNDTRGSAEERIVALEAFETQFSVQHTGETSDLTHMQ